MDEKERKLTDKGGKRETRFRFFKDQKTLLIRSIKLKHQHNRIKHQATRNAKNKKQKYVHEYALQNQKEVGRT